MWCLVSVVFGQCGVWSVWCLVNVVFGSRRPAPLLFLCLYNVLQCPVMSCQAATDLRHSCSRASVMSYNVL
ncbi:hypothetical protein ACOMHN_005785 [Nucella lapillus]